LPGSWPAPPDPAPTTLRYTGTRSYAFYARSAAKAAVWQEPSRPAKLLVRYVIQVCRLRPPIHLIPIWDASKYATPAEGQVTSVFAGQRSFGGPART